MLTSGVSGMHPWGRRLPTATAGALSRETFLTQEFPGHMAADRQVVRAGNAVEGLSMSGGAASNMSAYHPGRSTHAASLPALRTGARTRTDPIKCNKDFQAAHSKAGGSDGSSHFPPAGNHARPYRAAQLRAREPDLIATING
ncbi:hypothetical protein B7435_24510 [Mycolicibacterium peregrinum]|uniref:hypothetical protein n=1 Tax=Mycolicibacterium peregrinum TaxID=43304 RepID=UPI0006D81569|nr:hypothetical protein [Mycolicibacterium peregrinum]MCV7204839.1 hypothetical protein [Mycolicibacterium peregrinum]ORW59570.1 hypothetical protein AWC21_12770 [Mycolicibacterium peregrinum]OWL98719.1 hypothetical protein B7435_24510 [Mycolicibacterium peregrinum]